MSTAMLMSLSCNAKDTGVNNEETARMLIKHSFSGQATIIESKKPFVRSGDFNADGVDDLAVLFLPKTKPKASKQLKVSMPWVYPGVTPSKTYHKSLAIFHGDKNGWKSANIQAFALLDTLGVLETPSFELLITRKGDKDYKNHSAMLPIKSSGDLIILPTEAGIDTYVYWDKDSYKLLEPEEIP
jgi:hypothetical protein